MNSERQLSSASENVTVRDENDYVRFALARVAGYASSQINRLAAMYTSGIELHAWTARNLFEAYLVGEYIFLEPLKAKDFVAQKASDELQIYEGFLGISGDLADPIKRPILERIGHIRRTLAKHGLREVSPWSVSFLAKQTHNEADYKAFFKLYSKYVHPSAWLVFARPDEIDTLVFHNVFLIKAQSYGAFILKRAQEATGAI